MPENLSVQEFAARIREKHPGSYDDIPDAELTRKVVNKYPQYQSVLSTEAIGGAADKPSVWNYQGMGGPVAAIAQRAGQSVAQGLKEQFTPDLTSLAGPQGTPLRAAVDTYGVVKRTLGQPSVSQAVSGLAAQSIPGVNALPIEKLSEQIGRGDYPEALGTAALSAAEILGLMAAGGKPPNKASYVPEGLRKIGKGIGVPYSETTVKAAESIGTLAPKGSAREVISAVKDLDLAKEDLAKIDREMPIKRTLMGNLKKGPDVSMQRAINIVDYMRKLWDKSHVEPVARQAERPLNQAAVLKELKETITDEAVTNASPAEVKQARAWVQRNFEGNRTIGSGDKLMREINRSTDSPSAFTAYPPLLLRVKQLAGDALRRQIDIDLEAAGEGGIKGPNQRYGALRTVAQYMTESAISEATKANNATLLQKGLHTYGYLSPKSILPHGGMAINPGGFLGTRPSANIAQGMSLLGQSGIEPPPQAPPSSPYVVPAHGQAGAIPLAERVKGLPPIRLAPRTESVAAEQSPEVTVSVHPINKALSQISRLQKLKSKLSTPRQALTEQELAFVDEQGGISEAIKTINQRINKKRRLGPSGAKEER